MKAHLTRRVLVKGRGQLTPQQNVEPSHQDHWELTTPLPYPLTPDALALWVVKIHCTGQHSAIIEGATWDVDKIGRADNRLGNHAQAKITPQNALLTTQEKTRYTLAEARRKGKLLPRGVLP